ncbi:hypothetical protein [Pseudomonas aeruginosa]|uniref:hypothetical protein n=1 Tax=Pseudomonas aeruginosa TaxID=287 RepID=UPI003D6EEABE
MKSSTRDFLADIAQLAGEFRRQIEAEVAGFDPDPKASAVRRERASADYEYFARTYFPHYVKRGNALLHDYLYKRLPELVDHPDGQHEAIAAPRGNAKVHPGEPDIPGSGAVLTCVQALPSIIGGCLQQGRHDAGSDQVGELEFNPRLATSTSPGRRQGPRLVGRHHRYGERCRGPGLPGLQADARPSTRPCTVLTW